MGDELKRLLREGGGCIFESYDISLEYTLISHSLAHLMYYSFSDFVMPLCHVVAYAIDSAFIC